VLIVFAMYLVLAGIGLIMRSYGDVDWRANGYQLGSRLFGR
jgi:hypothetical protein